MKLEAAISRLEGSDEFREFRKENDHYLVHAFNMVSEGLEDWQLGYYDKDSDKVVVFEVSDRIKRAPEEDVLKRKETVEKLEMEQVQLDLDGALKVADKLKADKHPGETVTKKIVILQTIDGEPTYNMTLVTTNFNIINIRVSAKSGQVLKDSKQSIMNLGKPL